MSDLTDTLQLYYIGYLGRALDQAGAAYWENEIETGVITLEQFRANITNEQPEYINGIGSLTRSQQVEAFYQNLFERPATPEDLEYWVSGGGASVNADQLVVALIAGATEIGGVDLLVMDNKTEAANYYTEVGGGPDTYDKADATAAVSNVDQTAQSVKASKDATDAGSNVVVDQFQLTTLQDTVSTFGSEAALVKGSVNPGALNETLTTGDSIEGNAGTDLQLLVSADGPGAYVFLNNIADVNFLNAGGTNTISFDAGSWTGIGSINIDGGSGEVYVAVDDLEDGTNLSVNSGITGSVSADFSSGAYGWVFAEDDSSASLVDGDIVVDATGSGEQASVSWQNYGDDSGIMTGPIVGSAAGGAYAYVNVSASGDVTVPSVEANVGDSGTFSLDLYSDTGMVDVGDILADIGNSSSVDVEIDAETGVMAGHAIAALGSSSDFDLEIDVDTGDITMGDFLVTGGDGSDVTLSADVSSTGNITIGDIVVELGHSSSLSLDVSNDGSSGTSEIIVGDISAIFGDFADFELDFENDSNGTFDSLFVGDIDILAGFSADISLDFSVSYTGDLLLGDINIVTGGSSDIDVSVTQYYTGELSIGDINIDGGLNTTAEFYVYASDGTGDTTIGDVMMMTSGTIDSVSFSLSNSYTGDVTIGDITMSAGDDVDLEIESFYSGTHAVTLGNLDLSVGVSGSMDVEITNSNSEDAAGDLTIGDINLWGGNDSIVDVSITSFAEDLLTGESSGALIIGNIDTVIGNDADFDMFIYQSMDDTGDLGDTTIGDISLLGAVGSIVDIGVYVSNSFSSTGDINSVIVGNVSIDTDDGSDADYSLTVDNNGTGDIGSVVLGDQSLSIGVSATASYTAEVTARSGDIGSLSVGNISQVVGENGYSNGMGFEVQANGGGNIGTVSAGDIDISMDVSSSSSWVYVSAYATSGDVGSVSVGNVAVDMADGASSRTYFGAYGYGAGSTGTVTAGNFDVMMAASGYYQAYVSNYAQTSGDAGSISVGDVSVMTTGDSDMNMYVTNSASAGDAGDITVGDISVDLALSSTVTITVESFGSATPSGAGDGDISIGGVSLMGDGLLVLNIGDSITYSGDIDVGDITVGLSNSGELTSDILAGVATTGTVTVGNIDYSTYGTSTTIDVTGYLGAPSIIGSAFDDRILDNAETNIMTGGDGADVFAVNILNANLLETNADQVTDFTTDLDKLEVDLVDATTAAQYSEAVYADYDAFIADAAQQMMNGADEDNIVAGEIDGNTWVALDMDGDDTPDTVVGLLGVTISGASGLDFADFIVV